MDRFYLKDEIVVKTSSEFADNLIKQRTLLRDSEDKKCLEVTVDATHCGYFNHNWYFYTHDGMAKGVSSWLYPYNKPILSHHDEERTAIGRVTQSAFIPLVQLQMPNSAGKEETDVNRLRGKPSGKIRLKLLIVDQKAIDYILDQRFFTVSTGGSPVNSPTCSICKKRVIYTGGGLAMDCDHVPGKVSDGKVCGINVGEMDYKEVSFINCPADYSDDHVASVIGMQFVNANSSSDINIGNLASSSDKMPGHVIKDSVETKKEAEMGDKTKLVSDEDFEKLINDAAKELDACETCDEGVDSLWKKEDEIKEAEALGADYETAIGLQIGFTPEDQDYDDTVEDKKLPPAGSKARKKMKTTFCGPNKTFPIPDCKHAAVALAMLAWPNVKKKYDASVRARIAACVRARAKTLNCPMAKKKDSVETEITKLQQDHESKIQIVEQKVITLEKKIHEDGSLSKESKDELKKANNIIGELTKEIRIKQAEKVVDLSIMLQRTNMDDILKAENADERDAKYADKVKELTTRSSDSLNDSIVDLKKDLNLSVVSEKVDSPVINDFDQIVKDKELKKKDRKSWIVRKVFGE